MFSFYKYIRWPFWIC